jgi:ferrous iron transport protein A
MYTKENLGHLQEGDSGVVTGLLTQGAMRRRLLDLGLVEGTHVQCAQKSPAGDPVAYIIRGAVIALRREDACTVLIS